MSRRLAMVTSSPSGSTIKRILVACRSGLLTVVEIEPALIIATNARAGAIQIGPEQGMKEKNVLVLRPRDYQLPEFWALAVIEVCQDRGVDLVGLYGCKAIIPPSLIEAFPGAMVNQHPGPVRPGRAGFGGPEMYGMRVHAAVLHFAKNVGRSFPYTEATAQRVAPKVDEGQILRIEQVEIHPDDTPESLRDRVLPAEYRVQIRTLFDFGLGKIESLDLPDIVFPDEIDLLNEAKEKAIEMYPKG